MDGKLLPINVVEREREMEGGRGTCVYSGFATLVQRVG